MADTPDKPKLYAVATGSPFEGLGLYGPFPNEDTAIEWAEREMHGDDEW